VALATGLLSGFVAPANANVGCQMTVTDTATDRYVSFTAGSGCTVTIPPGYNSVTSLIVGGGGGGGGGGGRIGTSPGGGGAGGVVLAQTFQVNAGDTLTIDVGVGGAGGEGSSAVSGGNGSESRVIHPGGTLTATGGSGGGFGNLDYTSIPDGAGDGGGNDAFPFANAPTLAVTTPCTGIRANWSCYDGGGGGSGAGGYGTQGSDIAGYGGNGGPGGMGASGWIADDLGSATGFGVLSSGRRYFAGGGGGGGSAGVQAGQFDSVTKNPIRGVGAVGGLGGGGRGGYSTSGQVAAPGLSNSGSGGGGGGWNQNLVPLPVADLRGGAGANGLVILKFAWVNDNPAITGFSGRTADIRGGSELTMTGYRLQDVTSVTLNGKAVTIKTRTIDQLVIVTPPNAVGKVDLVLNTPQAIYTFQDAIDYRDSAAILGQAVSSAFIVAKSTTRSITTQQRQMIANFARAVTATGKISCTATYRKSAGSSDAATAKTLATSACAIAKQSNPLVTTEVGIVESTSSQRKVLLTLNN